MKKMTLLEMVQNIASALESDEINSITDTTESLQIAEVIKETFYEQFNNINVPEFQSLLKLDSVSSIESPNYLRVPFEVVNIQWLRYKDYVTGQYTYCEYVTPQQFMETALSYTDPDTTVSLTKDPSSGLEYYVRNDYPPRLFTMFDDGYLAFDSYDSAYETTLIGDNAIGYGTKVFDFEMEDDYIPPIDGNLFPLLLAEAKSVCFINLKQISSSKEEQRARRQRIRMQHDKFKSRQATYEYWNLYPSYARRR